MTREFKDGIVKEEAWKLCREFMTGPWKDISLDEFRLFEVRGGLSNTLYRCALPENMKVSKPSIPTEVLLRIYGPIQDDPNVVVTEAVTFLLLSERKLGPKLYGVLPKGRLEEFIPSRSLSSDELRKFSSLIATEMAKIHALDVPVRRVPDFTHRYLLKWLDEVKDILKNDKENLFLTYDEYKNETEWLCAEMKKADSPVVFCHNDLQGGNILCQENSTQNGVPKLMLIDFEFGGYNYRGFDIANHFSEWCFDYDTKDFPHYTVNFEKFPSQEEQAEWFSTYLKQLLKEGIKLERPMEEEMSKMAKEVNLFAAACHFQWHMWSIKMLLSGPHENFSHNISEQKNNKEAHNCKTGSMPKDERYWKEAMKFIIHDAHKEHGKTRKEFYHFFKEQYLANH